MEAQHNTGQRARYLAIMLGALATLALLAAGSSSVTAQSAKDGKQQTSPAPSRPESDQIINSYPMTITVQDDTSMNVQYTNPALNQNVSPQFFGETAEGVYLWVSIGGTTKVFGPEHVPAGQSVNPYTFISNTKIGAGTPSDPFVITTRVGVPGTNLTLTKRTSYISGAEFIPLTFELSQPSGSPAITATLFHAADLYTAGSDSGFGFYDDSTGGVGDYYTPTNRALYQQFVPSTPASAHMESYYSTIWRSIGNTDGPGNGFDNTIIGDTQHDSGAGLQWNLTVPSGGSVTVGDTDLFSPHQALCGSFSDVPYGSFYYDYVYYLACHSIVTGFGDTTFRPQVNVTRGQLSKIVANSAGFNDAPGTQIFEDVPPSGTYFQYIQRMATRGLISGYPCGGPGEPCNAGNRPYFRVNANASRGQIAKIVANAAGLSDTPSGQTYQDVIPGDPFYVYIQRLTNRGTMGGYTCGGTNPDTGAAETCIPPGNKPYFRPSSNATRGQTSKIDALTFFPTCCP